MVRYDGLIRSVKGIYCEMHAIFYYNKPNVLVVLLF